MNPLALGLALLAALAALESARRAFGAGPMAIARNALGAARRGHLRWSVAGAAAVDRVWPGRGDRAVQVVGPLGLVVVASAWGVSGWLGVALATLIVTGGAVATLRTLDRRRRRELGRQIPDLCERVAAAVRAGRSLRAAIARAAEESSGPGGAELSAIRRELDLGARLEAALDAACRRTRVPELRALSATIEVQQRAGGSLATALDALAERMRAEARLRADVRSATAQARASAWLVAGLPVAGGAAFELAAPGSAAALLGHRLGVGVVLLSATMYVVGLLAIMKMSGAPA